jgi:group I intron endonuclease
MDTYKATNTRNGKFYIGSTTNFERRKVEHLACTENYPFQNALRKNPEAFEWEVWSDDSDEPVLEQALLDMWFGKECCYNINPFASRPPSWEGKRHKESTKQKQSVAQIKDWEQNTGRRKRAAEASSQREWKQESKDKIGDSNAAKWSNNWEVEGPDGSVYTITNLRRFCREHDLNRSCMVNLVKGQKGQKSHRGFKLRGANG